MNINDILSEFHSIGEGGSQENTKMEESGLSRIVDAMTKYDTGAITAFRMGYSRKVNLQRNVKLLAQLQAKRYSVTSVRGGYIEDYGTEQATPVHENTFFVVNTKGVYDLLSDLRKLGEEYDQDSIMFIPKGGLSSQIWGTKNEPNMYFEYGEMKEFPNLNIGYKKVTTKDPVTGEVVPVKGYNRPDPEFFTLKARKPFFFESVIHEHVLPEGWSGRFPCYAMSKAPIEEQNENVLKSIWEKED